MSVGWQVLIIVLMGTVGASAAYLLAVGAEQVRDAFRHVDNERLLDERERRERTGRDV